MRGGHSEERSRSSGAPRNDGRRIDNPLRTICRRRTGRHEQVLRQGRCAVAEEGGSDVELPTHTALVLGLEIMMAYRFVQVDSMVAAVGPTGNGIVAGDPFATSFARSFLYPVFKAVETIGSKIGIDMRLRVFVGDVRVRVAGKTQAETASGGANVMNALLVHLKASGCEISEVKSVLMGSTTGI